MDHDKLVTELNRLQDMISNTDPTSEEYARIEERMIRLAKLCIELDEACDKQLERQDRLEVDRLKVERELDLREKEIELKNDLEVMKANDGVANDAARRRAEKRQAWWELIKIGLQVSGSAALILITGNVEQNAILGHNKWSLIPKVKF